MKLAGSGTLVRAAIGDATVWTARRAARRHAAEAADNAASANQRRTAGERRYDFRKERRSAMAGQGAWQSWRNPAAPVERGHAVLNADMARRAVPMNPADDAVNAMNRRVGRRCKTTERHRKAWIYRHCNPPSPHRRRMKQLSCRKVHQEPRLTT